MTSYSNECAICFDNLNSGDIVILNCPHKYHLKCIQKWIKNTNNYNKVCPQCNVEGEIINIIKQECLSRTTSTSESSDSPLIEELDTPGILECCTIL